MTLTNEELTTTVKILLEFIVEMTNHEGIPDMDDFMSDDQDEYLKRKIDGWEDLLIGEGSLT